MASSGKWIEGIGPDTPVDDAARRSLESRLTTVVQSLSLAAHLAEHDIEHVHRLRVSTRRAAAAIKLYRDLLGRKQARRMKRRLRKIRRAASDARDLDVLALRLLSEPDDRANRLVEFLSQRRTDVQPALVELAEECRRDDKFVRQTAKLLETIEAPQTDDSTTPVSFGHWAPRQLAKIGSDFVDTMPGDTDDVDRLHQFRIRSKAVRYAIELLSPAFGPSIRKDVYPAVEELQERLGTITDHIAAMRLFDEWEAYLSEHSLPPDGRGWVEDERLQQADDLQKFREWWTTERAEGLTNALAEQANALSLLCQAAVAAPTPVESDR